MQYKLVIEKDDLEGGWFASFPDIPEALTGGDTLEEAKTMAADALVTALEFYFEDERLIPLPEPLHAGDDYIELPASVTAKVLLLNAMLHSGITQAELARKLGTRPQEVTRLVRLGHATRIDTIANALQVLGWRLEMTAIPGA
ncbi:type II toxin-antitoxin system HicB family antitoxin [Yokenella regensburgei]|uniref:type II toxin-antitoxin system HicB family antitoxin n=1 Tax=Yokenella regensburgei TaxID=158877 RepID=UPI001375C369|nr:type II toxin-antitoxin system HicB family antitoxin [Yokenella regensburgei]KAF1368874.1 antitoxin HicB [Yokenella regensburgei]